MSPRDANAPPGGDPEPPPVSMGEEVREVFLAALAHMGGPISLAEWGKEHPEQFYGMLLKLVPNAEVRGGWFADVSDTPLSEAEWSRRVGA